jgi:hypothetical protein
MTTPNPARALMAEPRQLAAWALVGYAGLYLVISFLRWLVPHDVITFPVRSQVAGFTSLVEMALPVLAVLLATAFGSAVSQAKLITTVAVIEYAAILFFGVITFLIGLGGFGGPFGGASGVDVLDYLVLGVGRLGLAAVAGFVTFQAWTRLGGSLNTLTRSSSATPPPAPPAA